MLVVCERWVGDRDRLPHIEAKFFMAIAALFSGLRNRGSPKAQALRLELVLTPLASYLQLELELTDPSRLWHLVIFLFDVNMLPLIYTGASLDWRLGRGSICNTLSYMKFDVFLVWFGLVGFMAYQPL